MAFTVPKPSILVVGYPSNPTAEVVDLAFYERLVAWAKENQVWVLSDLAYSELYYDDCPTPSILQVPGAKDVAVEFTSMSKTYSMAGWRMGRSEEHTSELQSLMRISYAVFCLKKKNQKTKKTHTLNIDTRLKQNK